MQVSKINGLFEIHITVKTPESYYSLWKYVEQNKPMKLILAVSEKGDYKEQYMISKYKNGSYDEILDKTYSIVKDMEDQGIQIIRTKIESAAGNDGIPKNDLEFIEFFKSNIFTGRPYFEFHAKIDTMNNDIDNFLLVCEFLNLEIKQYDPDVHVATSTNICGSKVPLLTIRIYNHGKSEALYIKNILLNKLKANGYKISDALQQEFSVYDTNENVDKGWLI